MKRQNKTRARCALSARRWVSYAAAGAATAIAASNDSDAAILYSGPLNHTASTPAQSATLQLKTIVTNSHLGGSVLGSLVHSGKNPIWFGPPFPFSSLSAKNGVKLAGSIFGKVQGAVHSGHPYASKLNFGAAIGGPFNAGGAANIMASGGSYYPVGNWAAPGTGFLGFSFDLGGGPQFGWARVTVGGSGSFDWSQMTLVDYAYGTPGQAITAGETVAVPEPASLGLLALGAAGLFAIRKRKVRAASVVA